MPDQRVHLVRHGEVHNPNHVVYADLPGFDLSDLGRVQARATAAHLASSPVAGVWSSPLARALETASIIAGPHRLPTRVLPTLTEWTLLGRWRGVAWEEVPARFPGELEAYLADPTVLVATPETLEQLKDRMCAAVENAARLTAGPLVVVGHQDPLQAAVRGMTGLGLDQFHRSKPAHAEIITLEGPPWRLTGRVVSNEGAHP